MVKPYNLVSSNTSKFEKFESDTNGIKMLKTPDGLIYYPITISIIALSNYKNFYEGGDSLRLNDFFKYANWLKDNFEDNGEWGGWYTHHNLSHTSYNLPDKWLSAMSQGMGLSVMGIAYKLTKDEKYKEIGDKVVESFNIPLSDGGFVTQWGNHNTYLEYPTKPVKTVLNGFIFCLAGLEHYHSLTNNKEAIKLFNEGVALLKEQLPSYDLFFNSLYSQSDNIQTKHTIASATGAKYHSLHISQLLWLYKTTNDDFFYIWAHQFLKKDFNDATEYGLNNKFASIIASKSIDSLNYGTNNLNDKNWTYGKYWSTYKYPTTLNVKFNRIVNNLNNLIIVTTGETIDNENIELSYLSNNKWNKIVKDNINEYDFVIDNYKSKVILYNFAYPCNNVPEVEIKFLNHHTTSKVIAIREINFTYDMHEELEFLLEKLNY